MIKTKLLFIVVAIFVSSCAGIHYNLYPDLEEKKEQKLLESRRLQNSIGVIKKVPQALEEVPAARYHYPGLTDEQSKHSLDIAPYNWTQAIFTDAEYVRIKHSYFLEFNKWFMAATKRFYLKDLGDGYDCDNFAHLYKSLMSTAAYKNNSKREILVGVIFVAQRKDFGGIPAGKYNHALNLIGTEKGWFVIEPQTGEMCELKDYPNYIMWYIF